MSDIKVGDSIKVIGGVHKHCAGILRELKPTFCKVELTQNVKKKTTFEPTLRKVKKEFMELWAEDIIIEMPSSENLKVVDHFPEEEPNLMNAIEEALEKKSPHAKLDTPFLPQSQDKKKKPTKKSKKEKKLIDKILNEMPSPIAESDSAPLKEGECITENHIVEKTITMSAAEQWREECLKLREEVGIYRLLRFADVPKIVTDMAQIRIDYARLYEECDHKDNEIKRLLNLMTIKSV